MNGKRKIDKKGFIVALIFFCSFYALAPPPAHAQVPQQTPPPPSMVVTVPRTPLGTAPGDGDRALLADTLADALELSLQLSGLYEVQPRPTARTTPPDSTAVAGFARAQGLDYVIFGEIGDAVGGGTAIALRLHSTASGSVTLTRQVNVAAGSSTAALIQSADNLATTFLSTLTGRQIAWGRVEITNQAVEPGEHLVYVDGRAAGRNAAVLDRVPLGERLIEVVALDGPRAREVIASERIQLTARSPGRIVFSHSGSTGALLAATPPAAREEQVADAPSEDDRGPDTVEPPAADQDEDAREAASRVGTFVGLRLGWDFAWLGGQGYRDALGSDRWDSPSDGVSFSFLLEQGITERFSLEADLSLGNRGGKVVVRDPIIGDTRYHVEAQVLSLGVYLKPRTVMDRTSMYLVLGPQLLWIEEEPAVQVKDPSVSYSFDLEPDEEMLFGFVLGVGGDILIGRTLFFADLLYSRTINSFYDDGEWYFNNLTIGTGIKFRS